MKSLMLLKPVISEKAMTQAENGQVYLFYVPKLATKIEIGEEVAGRFGVKVVHVRTLVNKGKPKQTAVQRGKRRTKGQRQDLKKAYVVLAKGESIKLFEEPKK